VTYAKETQTRPRPMSMYSSIPNGQGHGQGLGPEDRVKVFVAEPEPDAANPTSVVVGDADLPDSDAMVASASPMTGKLDENVQAPSSSVGNRWSLLKRHRKAR
jgi:hypothetical protein